MNNKLVAGFKEPWIRAWVGVTGRVLVWEKKRLDDRYRVTSRTACQEVECLGKDVHGRQGTTATEGTHLW